MQMPIYIYIVNFLFKKKTNYKFFKFIGVLKFWRLIQQFLTILQSLGKNESRTIIFLLGFEYNLHVFMFYIASCFIFFNKILVIPLGKFYTHESVKEEKACHSYCGIVFSLFP